MEELGLPCYEDETSRKTGSNCGNLYSVWEGDPFLPPVLFSAHMDTVMPAYNKKPAIEEERIVSTGETVLGADDLAGVVEILEGIRSVQEKGSRL